MSSHTPSPRHSDTGPVDLQARNVEFNFDETPLHWIPDHPVASNVISMLNLLLPEGERWFVATFNEALPFVTDDDLATEMRGFIGQEAIHAEAHDKALWNFLERHGIDCRIFQRQMAWIFRRVLAPSHNGSASDARKDLIERLWLIAAIEHYTAILGNFALNNTWREHGSDPAMVDLFTWHGAEEVEHRCVAHDVAAYFADGYLRRGRAMAISLFTLLFLIHRGTRYIVRNDPYVKTGYLRMWYGWFRGARAGVLPTLRSIIFATFSYFKPTFYPDQIGSTAQAVAYLAASPATRSVA